MSKFKEIISSITPEKWKEAILRRRIRNIMDGFSTGWLSRDEAEEKLLKVVKEFLEIDKNNK